MGYYKGKTVNGEVQLQALVDGKKIIVTEASIRSDLQLNDEEGMDFLPNATIFEELTRMGYEKLLQKLTFYKEFFSPQWKFLSHTILQCLSAKTTTWNEFCSTMSFAIIYLATNQKFNFSKYIFESMVKNLDNAGKFLMYQRVGKGFSGRETPLFPTMVVQNQAKMGEGSAKPTNPHHTPAIIQPSTSQPQKKKISRRPKRKDTEVPQPSGPTTNVANKDVNEEMDDSLVRAATTKGYGRLESSYEVNVWVRRSIHTGTKAKWIMVEEPVVEQVKPMKRLKQMRLDEELAFKLQAEEEEEERLAREKAKQTASSRARRIETDAEKARLFFGGRKSKKAESGDITREKFKECRIKLEQESIQNLQKEVDDDQENTELSKLNGSHSHIWKEEISVDVIPLATSRIQPLEDLETLYKLVKAKYRLTRPVEDLDLILYGDLKTMFEPNVEDQVWKYQDNYKVLDWKFYDSCGVHSLRMQHVYIHMLVEKKFPLKPSTITDMLNRKLQVDHWNEMCYQLLKFIIKQLKNQ
ncbi:hypothetical protein Tco_0455396 [Tanacetum coccineum]